MPVQETGPGSRACSQREVALSEGRCFWDFNHLRLLSGRFGNRVGVAANGGLHLALLLIHKLTFCPTRACDFRTSGERAHFQVLYV